MRCKILTFLVIACALLLGAVVFKASERGETADLVMPSASQGAPYDTVLFVYEAPLVPLKPR